jgi:ketosteroid isomerase-like protein
MAKSADIAIEFIRRINAHDVSGLGEMMSEDYVFTDSLGKQALGRDGNIQGWKYYLAAFPDYQVSYRPDLVFEAGDKVVLLGEASGTYAPDGKLRAENRWAMPAAWRAVIRDNLVAEWQVYADNHLVFKIMDAHRASSVNRARY